MIKSTINKLRALRDVDPTGLANGDALLWNSTDAKFEPGAAGGGGGGGTPETVRFESPGVDLAATTSFVVGTAETNTWSVSRIIADDGSQPASLPAWCVDGGDGTFSLTAGTYAVRFEYFADASSFTATGLAAALSATGGLTFDPIVEQHQPVTAGAQSAAMEWVCPLYNDGFSTPAKLQVTVSALSGNLGTGTAYPAISVTKISGAASGGGGGLGLSSPCGVGQLTTPLTVAASATTDLTLDSFEAFTIAGASSSVMTWDAGTPTDIHLDKGIYEYHIEILLKGGSGTSTTSPAVAQLSASSTLLNIGLVMGGLFGGSIAVPVPYTSLAGSTEQVATITGKFLAQDADAANNIVGLSVSASGHGIVIDEVSFYLLQLTAL